MSPSNWLILAAVSVSFVSTSAISEDQYSLSTSRFIGVSFFDSEGNEVKTCQGAKASFGNNYVSIGIDKFTVNKNDPLVKRIFNRDRRAFAVSNLSAKYQNQTLAVARVGKPVLIKGKNSSIDMGVEWGIIERVPWVLRDATLKVRLGYTADSTIDSMIDAFEGVTAAIPDYTISTSLATGMAITSAVDKLLFGPNRALDLLNAERDLPLFAGQLCDGHYAIFSAKNNDVYEKYYDSSLVWTGNDLTSKGKPINDASYVVVGVRVSDRYYDDPSVSINDLSRPWASKYQEVQSSLFDLTWVSDKEQLDGAVSKIRAALLEARTLLSADINLIQQEKRSIHQHAVDDFKNRLEVASIRIEADGRVTKASTANALMTGLNSPEAPLGPVPTDFAVQLLQNPEVNLPNMSDKFSEEFRLAIGETRNVLSVQ